METQRRELTQDLFEPLGPEEQDNERIAGPSVGFWKDSWVRLKKNRGALVGLGIILALVSTAYVGPLLSPHGTAEQDLLRAFDNPSSEFWFGTDKFGRDLWEPGVDRHAGLVVHRAAGRAFWTSCWESFTGRFPGFLVDGWTT